MLTTNNDQVIHTGYVLIDRLFGWLHGTAVEHQSVTSELSLSYAHPSPDG